MSERIPEYQEYSLLDLYQVLNSIRVDLVPHVYKALVEEIDSREPTSVMELEDCFVSLDKKKNPEFAAKLVAQISALSGTVYDQQEYVTEENKYKTFWRRFWAHFLDGFVVAAPLLAIIFVLEKTRLIESSSSPAIDQLMALVSLTYYIVMHALFGQTAGKMATGVKIFDKSEELKITWKQAIARDIVPVIFFLISLIYLLFVGTSINLAFETDASGIFLNAYIYVSLAWGLLEVITMLFNSKKRAVHDFIAGTVVIRV